MSVIHILYCDGLYLYLMTSFYISYFVDNKWRKQRKIITPTFHFKILEQFVDVFNDKGEILVKKLASQTGKVFDVNPFVTLYALDVICGKQIFHPGFDSTICEILGRFYWRCGGLNPAYPDCSRKKPTSCVRFCK